MNYKKITLLLRELFYIILYPHVNIGGAVGVPT